MVMGNRFRGVSNQERCRAAPVPRKSRAVLHRPVVLSQSYRRLPLRTARFPTGQRAGPSHAGAGMEFTSEMVVKATLARQKIAEVPTSGEGRPEPPAAPADLAGWLASPAVPAPVQPAVAVLHPWHGSVAAGPDHRRRDSDRPITMGGVTFDVDTLVAAGGMVVIGFQSVMSGCLLGSRQFRGLSARVTTKAAKVLARLSLERVLILGSSRACRVGWLDLLGHPPVSLPLTLGRLDYEHGWAKFRL